MFFIEWENSHSTIYIPRRLGVYSSYVSSLVCNSLRNSAINRIPVHVITVEKMRKKTTKNNLLSRIPKFPTTSVLFFIVRMCFRPGSLSLPLPLPLPQAMDGFLLVLDKDGTILFVSESITAYIGLTQNDVIGLNLEEITHPDDRDIIHDNLVAKNVLPPGKGLVGIFKGVSYRRGPPLNFAYLYRLKSLNWVI